MAAAAENGGDLLPPNRSTPPNMDTAPAGFLGLTGSTGLAGSTGLTGSADSASASGFEATGGLTGFGSEEGGRIEIFTFTHFHGYVDSDHLTTCNWGGGGRATRGQVVI